MDKNSPPGMGRQALPTEAFLPLAGSWQAVLALQEQASEGIQPSRSHLTCSAARTSLGSDNHRHVDLSVVMTVHTE